jgi:hypothetical protein
MTYIDSAHKKSKVYGCLLLSRGEAALTLGGLAVSVREFFAAERLCTHPLVNKDPLSYFVGFVPELTRLITSNHS